MNNQIRMVLKEEIRSRDRTQNTRSNATAIQELIIPEHPDITGEVDKLLMKIAEAEDKMAVMDLHYGKNKTKTVL